MHRDICADQSINVQNGNYRMLAICTSYDDASPIELGSTDFIVLQRAADDGVSIAAELPGQGSGTGGKPGSVTTLQLGANAWGFQVAPGTSSTATRPCPAPAGCAAIWMIATRLTAMAPATVRMAVWT
ncbi:MAG: hypothetical protein DI584_17150 [Stenotrophomonas sp.]|nr:MAG: hypothetical protein DI584_17150 [Stenotrophomonas sp.]